MDYLLLAQAPVLSSDVAITCALIVALVSVVGVIVESRVKIVVLGRDADHLALRVAALEKEGQRVAVELASTTTMLASIKAGVEAIQQELHRLREERG